MTQTTPILRAQNIGFHYPGQAQPSLKGIDLDLFRGQAVGLLGPNGSGKSTFIDVLMGLKTPSQGHLQIQAASHPVIALVPQEYAFYPKLTCKENLTFFASMLNVSQAEARQRVQDAIIRCMLEEFADKPAEQCSGGIRRKLNIGIALLQKPDVLLLDEPTVGVDPQSRTFLLEQVKSLLASGCAVLYATHYMEEVSALCSHILLLDHGIVLASGDLSALLRHPEGEIGFDSLDALFKHYTRRSLRD